MDTVIEHCSIFVRSVTVCELSSFHKLVKPHVVLVPAMVKEYCLIVSGKLSECYLY